MFAEIDGARIFYELRGNHGSHVVLLHGWGCSSRLMEALAETLRGEHQVLLLDFPGHGQSSRPPEPWGVPEFAACIRHLLIQLDFLPTAVVGHSFGCRVAAWAGSEWPDIFTKMVFTGAAGLRAPATAESRKRAETFQKKKKLVHMLEKIPGLKTAGEKAEDYLRRKYGSADYNALDEEMRKTFIKVIQLDLRDRYPDISASTLLIWGDMDTETPLWMGKEIERLIPDAGLVILEGGSHFAYLVQAGRFNMIVKHFLTEEQA